MIASHNTRSALLARTPPPEPLPLNIPRAQCRTSFAAIEELIDARGNGNCPRRGAAAMADARDQIFKLGVAAGRMCELFLAAPRDPSKISERPSPDDDPYWTEPSPEKEDAEGRLGGAFLRLFAVAGACGIDMRTSILKKVELNGRKYPVELCRGKSGKYTNYSEHTGITTTKGQCTIDSPTKSSNNDMEDTMTVEGITLLIRNFAKERQWNRFHTPRNIATAFLGEFGELAELFQWEGDEGEIDFTEEELDKIGQEIADVSIYLLRLADVCHVRLGEVTTMLLQDEP